MAAVLHDREHGERGECGECGDWDCDCWKRHGLCVGANVAEWYPERGANGINGRRNGRGEREVLRARRICFVCPVRHECLTAALRNREHFGIWGGTNERDRRGLIRAIQGGRRTRDVVDSFFAVRDEAAKLKEAAREAAQNVGVTD